MVGDAAKKLYPVFFSTQPPPESHTQTQKLCLSVEDLIIIMTSTSGESETEMVEKSVTSAPEPDKPVIVKTSEEASPQTQAFWLLVWMAK